MVGEAYNATNQYAVWAPVYFLLFTAILLLLPGRPPGEARAPPGAAGLFGLGRPWREDPQACISGAAGGREAWGTGGLCGRSRFTHSSLCKKKFPNGVNNLGEAEIVQSGGLETHFVSRQRWRRFLSCLNGVFTCLQKIFFFAILEEYFIER